MTADQTARHSGWRGYRAVLHQGRARRLMFYGFVARLREGGIGLALVLMTQDATGSFALAGGVSAAYYLCGAVSRPVQGRYIDRYGHRQVLALTAIANAILLATVAAVAANDGASWLLIAVTALAGASAPAVSAALRALWPTILATEVHDAAYALDSLLYEVAIVIGPLAVGLISSTLTPLWAVIAVSTVGLAGTLGVAVVPTDHARPRRDSGAAPRPGLLDARFRSLVAVAFLVGIAEGPLVVAMTAAAVRDHASSASGPLVSALAVGSVLGMLFYGMRTWKATPPTRLIRYSIGLTFALSLLAASTASKAVVAVAVAAVLVGLALGPTITTVALCVNIAAPDGALAEAFAWISFATPCGAAAAQALAGALIAGPGPPWGVLLGVLGAGVAALFATAARRQQLATPA